MNRLLVQVVSQNPYAIAELVLPELGIDPESRELKQNLIPVDEEGTGARRHDQNWINKALAMELLAAVLLTCLDDPDDVYTPCVVDDNGLPKIFAQGNKADATATYPEFDIILEVSSKKGMSTDDFKTQMEEAIDHGGKRAIKCGKPVYALVVNECSIEADARMHEAYNSFFPIPAETGDVRPIPLSSLDFVDIFDKIHPLNSEKEVRFLSLVLGSALEEVYSHLSQGVDGFDRSNWTVKTIMKALRTGPEPSGTSSFDFGG